MTLHRINEARERRNARAMRAQRKQIKEQHNIPIAKMLRAVGIKQEPGVVVLQLLGEGNVLLAVTKLNEQGIKDLNDNLRSAAGIKDGLIWTP